MLTIRVDDRKDEKVVLVQETLNLGRVGVGQEIVRKVLDNLFVISIPSSRSLRTTRPTMVEIHSRACTVPWNTTAGFPFPPLPQNWMPVMGLPLSESPEVTIADCEGYDACKSLRN